ncbi:MAG: hypothetical protein EA401_04850 [Planctomycetota bacterium]|nr:MAG: hypothetical protein EA401_04850 [Planctomycetota bacterium]
MQYVSFAPLRQSGSSLIRFLITVVALAVVIYVAWITWSTFSRTGSADPRAVFDQEQRQAAHDDARPHFDRVLQLGTGAITRLRQLNADTFGPGGLIDQASDWVRNGVEGNAPIQEALNRRDEGSSAVSPETAQLEAQLVRAEATFQQALARYQQAEGDGDDGSWSPEQREHVLAAAGELSQVHDLLYDADHGGAFGVVAAYRARPDHHRPAGDHAAAMAEHTRQLSAAAQAMAENL